ncbi:uncharacterized protein BYT42DRAFT_520161 [Radiomyces spectabilis]|uniref:uncharacterized protein n=1 Tax=Radiomyces spectabilis TaxID=64574 RepID=UPI002220895D|nr:uncharacterized protein BYT42DRAFT_520161 [Radiomyces spectabilis]KAI8371702.1 hypothetical protein BYT42DRAFT_520161 [Radiomyces spectabilis]
MAQSYAAVASTDPEAARAARAQAQEQDNSTVNRVRHWFRRQWGGQTEYAPLIDRERGTLEPPRKTKFKIITTTVLLVIAVIVLGITFGFWLNDSDKNPRYTPKDYAQKFILENASKETVRDYLKTYTSQAHLAGTENDKRSAEWTRDQFNEFGLNATIETYWPMLNYPLKRRLALVSGPEELRYEASLREDVVDEDETSHNPDVIPTFHGYSKNGTAVGPVVYANYGRLEDFQYLADQGIELKGTIALMRYGGSFRGLKVRAAEQFGCIGALVYSDPIDDGPLNKDGYPHENPSESYPEGPWRSPSSAQRGSVLYLSLASGDPLTPGYAATENATRIKPEDAVGLAKIPSLPLSWEDALPLLKATQNRGIRKSEDWSGGLTEVDYYSGPTEGNVVLVNEVENKVTPIWNVIARIEGTEEADRAIILGNHRDAWVYGAVDPSSGSASMMEVARLLGSLYKEGWRPRRTIILASWDGEEYGLIGSTEWAEDHSEWLSKEAAVYINVDVAVSGSHFTASASPSLNRLLYEVTQGIPDPRTGKSLYEAWGEFSNRTQHLSPKPLIGQLGSGSDFVAFLDHLGIASIDMGFSGDYGVYHSNYDSFHWMEKFGDPGFDYHQTMAKIMSTLAVRLADDLILPMHPMDYAVEVRKYIDGLGIYASPHTFPLLEEAADKLAKRAGRFEQRLSALMHNVQDYGNHEDLPSVLAKRVNKANQRLMYFERGFLDSEGLPGREWFKHVVYAPGLWTGYSSQVFPAIVEAVDARDFEAMRRVEARAGDCIVQASERLRAH